MVLRRPALFASAVAAALVLTACSDDPAPAPAEPEASEGTAGTITEISPLTGEPLPDGKPSHPVFVVKIENTSSGAPQYGLSAADVVVEELVEGGLTRLAAMYYSEVPGKVGHVRSLRGTDVGIAKPVGGRIVATGGAPASVSKVARAKVAMTTEDTGGTGFSLDGAKSAPYNRLVDLAGLAKRAKAPKTIKPYFEFTPIGEDGLEAKRQKATRASVRFSAAATTQWKLSDGRWVRTNGHANKEFRADTLVVMFAPVGDAGYRDPAGNPVPETTMKGSGRAVVLTKDGALESTWSKKESGSTVSLKTRKGTPIPVDPGKTWVELVPKGDGAVSYS